MTNFLCPISTILSAVEERVNSLQTTVSNNYRKRESALEDVH